MTILWHPETPEHLQAIDRAIDEMDAQHQVARQKMTTIAELNQGQTISAVQEYYDTQVAPRLSAIIEDFHSFVSATRSRYQAAVQQDEENSRIS